MADFVPSSLEDLDGTLGSSRVAQVLTGKILGSPDIASPAVIVQPFSSGQTADIQENRIYKDGSLVVGSRIDATGCHVHEMGNRTNDQVLQVWSDDPHSCHFGFGIGSSPNNDPSGLDPQKNVVFGWGYNYKEGGPLDPSQPSCTHRIESNYYLGGVPHFEVHLGSVIFPGVGGDPAIELRPITYVVNKTSKKPQVAFGTSTIYFNEENHSNQLGKLYRTTDGLTRFYLCDSTGDPGFSLETIGTGTQRDTLNIGRATSAQFASATFNATTSTSITYNAGANSSFYRLAGNILTISGATGGSMVLNTDTWSLINRAGSRFIIRGSDNGSAPGVGFLGAAPSTRVTMGAATAAASYGAAEQAMLQKAYDVLRTFGLGT
ncbi:hypothetical protein V5E97_06755 [Singulisphaera sp. Ch08]|uniref:Uncharacterized protein n=1 Tax=Singulisphaera sp. Ch08 TaxID=3120278 RepID=A0AAU7CKV2_9BACT